jgi:hypothetical protein
MNAVHLKKCPSLGYRFRHFLFYSTPSINCKSLFFIQGINHAKSHSNNVDRQRVIAVLSSMYIA